LTYFFLGSIDAQHILLIIHFAFCSAGVIKMARVSAKHPLPLLVGKIKFAISEFQQSKYSDEIRTDFGIFRTLHVELPSPRIFVEMKKIPLIRLRNFLAILFFT
jgi:hypothetical protein